MSRKKTLCILLFLLFLLAAVYGLRLAVLSGRHGIYVETEHSVSPEELMTPGSGNRSGVGLSPETRIDINSAPLPELDLLPGVGLGLAGAIIEYRDTNGPFSSPEELKRVSGIGDSLYARLEPYVTVSPSPEYEKE